MNQHKYHQRNGHSHRGSQRPPVVSAPGNSPFPHPNSLQRGPAKPFAVGAAIHCLADDGTALRGTVLAIETLWLKNVHAADFWVLWEQHPVPEPLFFNEVEYNYAWGVWWLEPRD